MSRLLIVEDDPSQLRILSDIMSDEGYEVIGCSTAAAATAAAEQERFAVVILDYRLPDLNGTQLLERICTLNPRVRAIIHTAFGTFHSAKDAVNAGAFAYVEKMGDPDELVRQVHRAFRDYAVRYTADLEEEVSSRTARLRESTEMIKALINAAPIAIATLDRHGCVRTWNPAAERLFQWTAEEVIGQPPPTVPPDQISRHREMVERELQGEHHASVELRRLRKDGAWVDVLLWTAPLVDHNGQIIGTIGMFDDITERKRMADVAQERQAQLAHAMRLNSMGKMISELAHEIGQPLYSIANYASACRSAITSGAADSGARFNQLIAEQAERAQAIIRRLKNFVRKDSPGSTAEEMNDLIHGIVPLVNIGSRLHGRIRLSLAETEMPIVVDRVEIEQVLVNLISNAFEAMPPSGGEAEVEVRSRARDGEVEVAVQDFGPPIDDEHLARLFEPYFTTKPDGIGLGLPICRSSVEAHKGRLWVERNPEQGLTFYFTLPLTEKGRANE